MIITAFVQLYAREQHWEIIDMNTGIFILYITTAAGLILIKKIRPAYYILIVLLLLLTSLNETWVTVWEHQRNALLFYNIFSLVEMVLWSLLLVYNNDYRRKWVHFLIIIALLIGSFIEISLRSGFHSYTYRAFSIYGIISCLVYYYQLTEVRREEVIMFNGRFWILTGLLLFQFVFAFYLTALDLPEFRAAVDALYAFRVIFNIINIAYYLLLLYGILCLSFYRR